MMIQDKSEYLLIRRENKPNFIFDKLKMLSRKNVVNFF